MSEKCCDNTDKKKGIVYPMWIAVHLLDIFILCFMADSTEKEAVKTGTILHRLTYHSTDIEYKKKVKIGAVLKNQRVVTHLKD